MTMATTDGKNTFHGFGTRPAGKVTTITSESDYRRAAGRPSRNSLLPFRHVSSSSEEDGGSSANHRHSRRFHQGLKLLDLTAKTRAQSGSSERRDNHHHHQHHVQSQESQGSGSGNDAPSPSSSTTSFPAMTKGEFEALPPTIRRKVSRLVMIDFALSSGRFYSFFFCSFSSNKKNFLFFWGVRLMLFLPSGKTSSVEDEGKIPDIGRKATKKKPRRKAK